MFNLFIQLPKPYKVTEYYYIANLYVHIIFLICLYMPRGVYSIKMYICEYV